MTSFLNNSQIVASNANNDLSLTERFIAGCNVGQGEMYLHHKALGREVNQQPREPTAEDRAQELICDAENLRAKMYDLPGKQIAHSSVSISRIDEDYQMVDSHVDAVTRAKIANFEFIEFSILLPRNRYAFEDEHQHLEIINKNGVSFLSPVSEQEAAAITSYS